MRHLSESFPGVRFVYQAAEPPAAALVRKHRPLYLRILLSVFGTETRYPSHWGYFESGTGGAVEFYFPAAQTVRWMEATLYGRTASLGDNLHHLSAATGWIVKYPRF